MAAAAAASTASASIVASVDAPVSASYASVQHALSTLSADEFDKIKKQLVLDDFNKAKWMSILELYDKLSRYGIIFGGAVRDYVQRIIAAKEFYAHCEINGLNAKRNYNNPNVLPENHVDRNLFPTDIDVFISESKLDEFLSFTKIEHILVKRHMNARNYFLEHNPLFKLALRIERWNCSLIQFSSIGAKKVILGDRVTMADTGIKIDFVIIKDEFLKHPDFERYGILYPPFGNPDFDVNLLMFKHDEEDGLVIQPMPYIKLHFVEPSQYRYHHYVSRPLEKQRLNAKLLEDIIANIKTKRARALFPNYDQYRYSRCVEKEFAIDTHRINKIHRKGFTFDTFETIFPKNFEKFWAPDDYEYVSASGITDNTDDADTEANADGADDVDGVELDDSGEEVCLICQDVFSHDRRWFKCCTTCTGKMHMVCFTQYLQNANASQENNTLNCPQCRTDISSNCKCRELTFLNKLELATINKDTAPERCGKCDKFMTLESGRRPRCLCWKIKCRWCHTPTVAEVD